MNDSNAISPTEFNTRKKRVFERLQTRYWKPLIQTYYPSFSDWSSITNFKTGTASPSTSMKILEMLENIADAIDRGRQYLGNEVTVGEKEHA